MSKQMPSPDGLSFPEIANDVALSPNTEETLNSSHNWDFALEVQVVDFLSGYAIEGMLEGFTPGEVTVSLGEPVSEQRMVKVEADSFSFEGTTLYCQPSRLRFEVHISIDDSAKTGLRRTPRFPIGLPGRLFPSDASAVEITIVDISQDGLGIELSLSLEVGQPVAIASGSIFVFAVVRHCRQTGEGLFRAGCEMHHIFERPVQPPAGPSSLLRRIGGTWPFARKSDS